MSIDGWASQTVAELGTGRASTASGPFGSNLVSRDYTVDGVPVIRGENVGQGRWVSGPFVFVSEAKTEALRTNLAFPGDLVFTQRGTLGQVALIPDGEHDRYVLSQSQMRLRPDPGRADALFLYYLFTGPEQQEYIRAHAIQTGVPHTNLGILRGTPLRLPPIDEQLAIASVLGALDDKIELNRRMNETLEALARAIFTSWFVDFDPVRARAEGRQPVGMDAETAALFPDRFEDSPLGPIPSGWSVSPIGDAVTVVGGSTPRTEEPSFWNGDISFATPKDLAGVEVPVLLTTARAVTEQGAEQVSSRVLDTGTVLLSSRAPIGYLAITEIPVVVNQGFIAMKCSGPLPNLYVLRWAEQNMPRILASANGTTFPEVSKANFRPIPVLVPASTVLRLYLKIARPIHDRVVTNVREARVLGNTRDTLLPKLVSGEIRLNRAREFAG